eukprot:g42661.t1
MRTAAKRPRNPVIPAHFSPRTTLVTRPLPLHIRSLALPPACGQRSLSYLPPASSSRNHAPVSCSVCWVSSSSSAAASPMEVYKARLARNEFREDERQRKAMEAFDELWHKLEAHPTIGQHRVGANKSKQGTPQNGGGLLSAFTSWLGSSPAPAPSPSAPFKPDVPGLYVYGGVGCGKTMLMDTFFDCVRSRRAKREHFHAFMLDIHGRLHRLRKERGPNVNPLPIVARDYVRQEADLLCLDEFQVTDVADAMILKELFTSMMEEGCVLVSTSNRAPNDLYLGGINRSSFLPFIELLKEACLIHSMGQGQDHRLLGTLSEGAYHTPLNEASRKAVEKVFKTIAGNNKVISEELEVMMGRRLTVPRACKGLVAEIPFKELCDSPLGAADFLALATAYPTVIIPDVPCMPIDNMNVIRRFITLLDVLYDKAVVLILRAEAPPYHLFVDPKSRKPIEIDMKKSSQGQEENTEFALARAVSRLIEMESEEYINGAVARRKQAGLRSAQCERAPDRSRTLKFADGQIRQ